MCVIRAIHELKTEQAYFSEVWDGKKRFEIRKDDRNFAVDDTLVLREIQHHHYTGNCVLAKITYMTDFMQREGYKVLGIEIIANYSGLHEEYMELVKAIHGGGWRRSVQKEERRTTGNKRQQRRLFPRD
ncbi:DUF3850 domain-containing protein [Listeria booriae]|uniref:DUF3850 domain-containing protein n=1 Tax=Listeria booriae TaxID=1552123 RepID=A0A842G4W1_9LIST|nr:DUF3850 domain-containing protein [Listeria booriae]MBC2294734.1 DUF3850 domain-containing protein [Listeria booriae]